MPTIGPYTLANRVALAPMAGVTDLPFRRLCARFGAGLVVSEMITSRPELRGSRKSTWRSRHDFDIEPRSVQIAGNEPAQMAEAARYNVARGAQIIDINMGCPAKKVCRKAAGSASRAEQLFGCQRLARQDWVNGYISLEQYRRQVLAGMFMTYAADATPAFHRRLCEEIEHLKTGP